MVEAEKDSVENLIGQLVAAPLPKDKPLWQVHVVEDYYDAVGPL